MGNRVQQNMLFSGEVPAKILPKSEPFCAPEQARKRQKIEREKENSSTESCGSCTEDPPTPVDCEIRILDPTHDQNNASLGLIRIEEGEEEHKMIKKKLESGLTSLGVNTTIESIKKNDFSSSMKKAKLLVFSLMAKAVEKKSGLINGNVQFAWFGASKKELTSILQHGFSPINFDTNGRFGHGVYLCPDNFPLGCMNSATADENGVRHLLCCRVILGKTEVVGPGSKQWHPTCQEYDSGVDNLVSPTKYIVWSTIANTHILPHYIISFKISSLNEVPRNTVSLTKPNSPWISFPTLVSELEKVLSPQILQLIATCVKDHREGKLTRLEMVKCVRKFVGDELLIKIVKTQKDKQINASIGFQESSRRGIGGKLLRHGCD